jgi:PKD repeat protein
VPASVTLPAGSTTPVTVTVTGVDDDIVDGDIGYIIITGDPTSTDLDYDALGAADVADISVTNQDDDNTPPIATNVNITGTARVGELLTGNYTYSDAEGDLEGISTFRWLRDDIAIAGATAQTYTLVAADEGTMIKFEVTPIAQTGTSPGVPVQSDPVGPVAPNLAPVATSVNITGTARVGEILTGNYAYSDAEGDLEGISTFRWLRDDIAIAGATAQTYTLVAADEGTMIKFEVTPVAQTGTSPGVPVQSEAVGPIISGIPTAKFKAEPTEGIAPLSVQFTDLSEGNITEWHWDFGDGETSNEQNPKHTYNPAVDPKYTVSLTVTGPGGKNTLTKIDYITVYIPIEANFDAEPTVGLAPLEVHFKNLTIGSADTYEWAFGDGETSLEENPVHVYTEPGTYEVYLWATGPGGKDEVGREKFVTIYEDSTHLNLKLNFVQGSQAYKEEPWQNAIDADTWGWDGTATVEGDTAWAIFEFKDQETKIVDHFRLMSNTGVWFKDRWVKEFRVQLSKTGTLPEDFVTVLDTTKQDGEWETFWIEPDSAKYVKLIIDNPASGWRQVGEFEVYEADSIGMLLAQNLNVASKISDLTLLVPDNFALLQNYPNPFNPETIIEYQLPELSKIRIRIFNLAGQELVTLIDTQKEAGRYQVVWNGRDKYGNKVSSGIYLYSIEASNSIQNFKEIRRMTLIK